MVASAEPPRTVKSSPSTTTGRPSSLARPITQLAGVSVVQVVCGVVLGLAGDGADLVEAAGVDQAVDALAHREPAAVVLALAPCRRRPSRAPCARAASARRAHAANSCFRPSFAVSSRQPCCRRRTIERHPLFAPSGASHSGSPPDSDHACVDAIALRPGRERDVMQHRHIGNRRSADVAHKS